MRTALASLVLCMLGCNTSPPPTDTGVIPEGDALIPGRDASTAIDAGVHVDGGGADAATPMPEVCTGGLDEDGDTAIDCMDPDCFGFADCVAADVAHTTSGLVPCGDPIVIDAAASRMACTTLGTPMFQTIPTDCTTGPMTATARVFCGADGHAAALWIDEEMMAPETQQMIDARHFRETYYERENVIDWERQESGPSAREGGSGFPIHEWQDNGTSGNQLYRVITVRSVLGGDRISRLLGFAQITSLIDLDSPMSMDTRQNGRLGGLILDVPTP